MFPSQLTLDLAGATNNPPQGLGEVLTTLLFKVVDNPINAIATGNFIGILVWVWVWVCPLNVAAIQLN